MSTILDTFSECLAVRLKSERETRGWTLAELSERSGVSRAMISKVERNEASPTAELLGRLSGAFRLTVSTLLARAEQSGGRVAKAADQPVWRDPETAYVRRAISPQGHGPLELVQVQLPVGARVQYPASTYTFIYQQLLILSGELNLHEGDMQHRLKTGDCLAFGTPTDCTFHCPGPRTCTYLVAVVRR